MNTYKPWESKDPDINDEEVVEKREYAVKRIVGET